LTLLVGRQEGHPVCKKTEWWGAGMVICLEQGADLHMAQLMPLPLTISLLTLLLTLCGLTSQKTHQEGLGLGGSVHEEAHPCFPCFVQPENPDWFYLSGTGLPR